MAFPNFVRAASAVSEALAPSGSAWYALDNRFLESREIVMSTQPRHRYSPAEYLELDREADYKSEFLNGEIFAMGGASARHALIVVNASSELRSQLRERPCTVYSTDLRVRASEHGLWAYPDVVVICGEPKFVDEAFDTVENPILIVEVLSPSTKNYDRGEKFEHYRKLESLREYVLIAQDKPLVEHYVKQQDGTWVFSEAAGVTAAIELPSIGCSLALSELYAKVEFDPSPEVG